MYMQVPTLGYHTLVKIFLAQFHTMDKASKNGISQFWLLKALMQLFDLHIYHPDDVTVANAFDALLPGKQHVFCHIMPCASVLHSLCMGQPKMWS